MIEQAVILAGGKGTRLGALAQSKPKALVDVAGQPLIVHQFEVARRYGVKRVLMLSGHLGDELEAGLGDGSRYGLSISYLREDTPLGTAGALKGAEALLDNDFFVLYGDIIFDMDLARLAAIHLARRPVATLVVHPNDHPHDSDLVEIDDSDRIVRFHPKTRAPGTLAPNLVNAGIYVLSKRVTGFIEEGAFADFGLNTFPAMLAAGQTLIGYNTPEFMKDVGTLDRRAAVERDIVSGKVARRNIGHPQAAVFLDRDGVINPERPDPITAANIELLPGVAKAIGALNRSDFLSVVATNQPGVAKGFLSEAELAGAHMKLDTLLGAEHAFVHGYYVCSHHPDRGFAGERAELKIVCDCRKPEPGLLLQAADRFNIDLGRSFMVGDRSVDIEAGRRAGVATIGVRTGYAYADQIIDVQPDFMCDDLGGATDLILAHQFMLEPARQVAALGRDVVIGGLSRAGKSVFATLVRWQMRRLGRDAAILGLDTHLKPEAERRQLPRIGERFDEPAIAAALAGCDPGRPLVVEGVPALLFEATRTLDATKIFIRTDEQLRRDRFIAFYVARGRSEAEAQVLYNGRDVEERSTINATASIADLVVEPRTAR